MPFPPVNFSIEKKYESTENTTVYHGPLLVDIDGDCIPEIILAGTTNYVNGTNANTGIRLTSGIRIVNSQNGQTINNIATANYAWSGASSFAIADVDGNGIPELILAAADHTSNPVNHRGRLICYDFSGNILWVSNEQYGQFAPFKYGGTPGLADFNQDGIPEVYIYNEIFNAQNGVKLCDGGNNGIGRQLNAPLFGTISVSVAGQFDDNPNDLELAAGYSCYKVNITNPNGIAGNSMTPRNMSIEGQLRDGYTSFGDINQDGKLDIIVSSPVNTSQVGLYVYTIVGDNAVLVAGTTLPSGGGSMPLEIGPAFVGDIDGSGSPTIGITRPYRLLTYKYNGTTTLQLFWQINTNDVSGQTGMTMFDFNQDGVQEIIYRDETTLRIINGSVNPPADVATFPCFSGTAVERPIVGDIDNTGEAKICITCGTSNVGAGSFLGKLYVFGSASGDNPWAPARGIWNQYQYHVLNVNDDLSIPQFQQNNAAFLNGNMNNFYVQSSWLDNDGQYLWGVADLSVSVSCIEIINNEYVVTYQVGNESTASLASSQSFEVLFFDSNPTTTNANMVYTTQITTPLQPGDFLNDLIVNIPINSVNTDELFVIINANPNFQPPSLLDPNQFILEECNYDNNLASISIPQSIQIQDTICNGQTVSYHGQDFNSDGYFEIILPNQQGCDSIIFNLTLTLLQNFVYDTITVTACNEYQWFGSSYSVSGQYEHVILGSQCDDSIYVLNLTIEQPIVEVEVSSCDSLFIQNSWVFESTAITESFPSSNTPCDSVVVTQITIYHSQFDTVFVQSCENYTIGNQTFTTSGIYDVLQQTDAGCEAHTHLNLEIIETFAVFDSLTACGSLEWGNLNISTTGVYNQTFLSQQQCDSLVTLLVNILPVHEYIINRYTCDENDLTSDTVYFTNSYGCDSIEIIQPILYPQHLRPVAAFSATPNPINIDALQSLNITNLSYNASFYHWQIPTINYSSDHFNPIDFTISDTGQYPIFLTVSDENGCSDSTQLLLIVREDISVFVPNTFTPDGDAFNNTFIPVFSGPLDVYNYELLIFNRWGEIIFESKNPSVGWDGTYGTKIPVQDGTYIWKIKYKPVDRAEKQELVGHVNVLR